MEKLRALDKQRTTVRLESQGSMTWPHNGRLRWMDSVFVLNERKDNLEAKKERESHALGNSDTSSWVV